MFTDSDPKLISATGLETFLGHFPAGASFQQIHHFSQEIVAQKFQMYDHGEEKNMQLYGAPQPPMYNMFNIQGFPIALMGGLADKLASPEDFRMLRNQLHSTNSCVFYKEYDYGHVAFLIPADKTIFFEMAVLISQFNSDFKQPTEVQPDRAAKLAVAMKNVGEIMAQFRQ